MALWKYWNMAIWEYENIVWLIAQGKQSKSALYSEQRHLFSNKKTKNELLKPDSQKNDQYVLSFDYNVNDE